MKAAQIALLVSFALLVRAAVAIDNSVPAIHGDLSRTLLGDGTGVIIGIVDSGVDSTHPAIAGNDSLGNPRLVAQQNFVGTEPGNTGDDVFGHGTWISSVMLSKDPVFTGLATDARYVNARVLNSSNSFSSASSVLDGIGFALANHADVINISLNYFSDNNVGSDPIERMLDWAAYSQGVNFTNAAGNISTGSGTQQVRGPASAYNGMTVGRTTANFNQVHFDSSTAPTGDGRSKPDVVAPGTLLTMANANWETGPLWDPTPRNGTSFAAPHVAGMMAQEIDYGRSHGLSTNPLVIKATMMNSAVKVADKDGSTWKPRASGVVGGVLQVTSPLDTDQGAGQIDGLRLFQQYSAGQQGPGAVNPIGWDLHTITGVSSLLYDLHAPVFGGSVLDVTLDWFRHMNRIDNGDGMVNAGDSFIVSETLDNLNLSVLLNGTLIASSMSTIDNIEYLHLTVPQTGLVSIQVDRLDVSGSGNDELYALAWSASPVPEPATALLAAGGFAVLLAKFRRRRI